MTTLTAPAEPRDVHRLRAHELWGGSDAGSERLEVAGFHAAVLCRPHAGHAAGGDLRFVSTCAAGQIVRFTLADVAGHGEEATAAAQRLRALMRKHLNTPNPSKLARALNEEFRRLAQGGRFATALISTYFCPTDHMIVCNAGHPRPLLRRASTGRWVLLDETCDGVLRPDQSRQTGIANLPLGVLSRTQYPMFAIRLDPDDLYVSYTDALVEAKGADGRDLGENGLLDLVSGLPLNEPGPLGWSILSAVERYRGGAADDDATVLVLRHTATDPPAGAWEKVKTLGRLVGIVR